MATRSDGGAGDRPEPDEVLDLPTSAAPAAAAAASAAVPTSPYSATDILPIAEPGGRRARREEAEARQRSSRTAPTPLGRAVVPAAIAVVCAVALTAAWLHLQGDRATVDAGAPPAPVSSAPVAPSSSTPSPSATPSLAPPSASATAVVPPPSPSSSASASNAPGTADRSVPVVVLNATGRTGVAASVAAQLKADGWKVVSVGNFTPRMALTTLFVEGNAAAAATMVSDLGAGAGRVQAPRSSMPAGSLVVVVGLDYRA